MGRGNTSYPFHQESNASPRAPTPTQASFYLHLIGWHVATWSLISKESWGSKLDFPASLVKGDKREGGYKLLWSFWGPGGYLKYQGTTLWSTWLSDHHAVHLKLVQTSTECKL